MKTISFEEAWALLGKGETLLRQYPGDEAWVEVRINPEWSRVEARRGDRWDDGYGMKTLRAYKWAIREDPPKVERVCFSRDAVGVVGIYIPEGEHTALIFPADLLKELDEAAKEWFRTPSSQCRSEHRLFTALSACGIGTPKSGEGDER